MDPLRTHAPTTSKCPDPPILARIPRGSPADPLWLPGRSPGVPHAFPVQSILCLHRNNFALPIWLHVDAAWIACRLEHNHSFSIPQAALLRGGAALGSVGPKPHRTKGGVPSAPATNQKKTQPFPRDQMKPGLSEALLQTLR